jgi:hypothetical protein
LAGTGTRQISAYQDALIIQQRVELLNDWGRWRAALKKRHVVATEQTSKNIFKTAQMHHDAFCETCCFNIGLRKRDMPGITFYRIDPYCFFRRSEAAGGETESRTKLDHARGRISPGNVDQSGTILECIGRAPVA